VFDESTLPK